MIATEVPGTVFAYGRNGMAQYHHDNATGKVYAVHAIGSTVQDLDYGMVWDRREAWPSFNRRLCARLRRDGWPIDR